MASEEVKKIVMGLRPIDDDFMKVIFQDNTPLVEYVLRVILGKDDLTVQSSETQKDSIHFGSRQLIFDIFATDSLGQNYNIEVQRADSGASPKRARYHSAALDIHTVPAGADLNKVADSYVIFITENDVLKGNKATYHIERVVSEMNEPFGDGAQIIYVNGAYQDVESSIGKLIHDFVCRNANDMLCAPMADVTYKYKNTHEGVDYMCKAVEEYGMKQRNEGIQEGIIKSIMKMIKQGKLSYDQIAEGFDVPIDEVRKLAAQMT